MIERLLLKDVKKWLNHFPSVAILGPRQIGKTSLAKEYIKSMDAHFFDLEDYAVLEDIRSHPNEFFKKHSQSLVVLDEVQRLPDIFMVLRRMIDASRRAGKKNHQYIFLCSASGELLRQTSESLAGRIFYTELTGLLPQEVCDHSLSVRSSLTTLWFRGGFPESYRSPFDEVSYEWRRALISSYIHRDMFQVVDGMTSVGLNNLWVMLAHRHGETVQLSKLATPLKVSESKVSYCIDVMVELMLVRKLLP